MLKKHFWTIVHYKGKLKDSSERHWKTPLRLLILRAARLWRLLHVFGFFMYSDLHNMIKMSLSSPSERILVQFAELNIINHTRRKTFPEKLSFSSMWSHVYFQHAFIQFSAYGEITKANLLCQKPYIIKIPLIPNKHFPFWRLFTEWFLAENAILNLKGFACFSDSLPFTRCFSKAVFAEHFRLTNSIVIPLVGVVLTIEQKFLLSFLLWISRFKDMRR